MRNGIIVAMIAVCACTLAPVSAGGQTAGTSAAPAIPRTPEGRPDFAGIWQVMTSANWDIQDHHAQKGMPAGQGVVVGNEIPYQPWAAKKKQENFEKRATDDPEANCYL